MAKDKTPGRPPASRNRDTQQVDGEATRCAKCGSTERSSYFNRIENAYSGIRNGQPYTHVVKRRCDCLACGQRRIDRIYENRPAKKK